METWFYTLIVKGNHVHTCPECHEDVACEDTCSCPAHLERDDGTQRGAFHVCAKCAADGVGEDA